jgi:pseudouridine-5'-phosphate glycosidase
VLALESTIVAHGLPWPDNLDIGRETRGRRTRCPVRFRRRSRCSTALRGSALSDAAARALAREAHGFVKAGAADLPVIISRARANAATTVSATCGAGRARRHRVFATGGIGGVHRGDALRRFERPDHARARRRSRWFRPARRRSSICRARSKCSRRSAVLRDRLPHGRVSGLLHATFRTAARTPTATTVEELARVLQARWALDQGGVLIANPIPEEAELPAARIGSAISEAVVARRA